jgi:hypothetical protein
MKQLCDGGLPASAAAIHGHNPRSIMTLSISVENQMDNVTDRRYSPWTRRRLPGAKLHVQSFNTSLNALAPPSTKALETQLSF